MAEFTLRLKNNKSKQLHHRSQCFMLPRVSHRRNVEEKTPTSSSKQRFHMSDKTFKIAKENLLSVARTAAAARTAAILSKKYEASVTPGALPARRPGGNLNFANVSKIRRPVVGLLCARTAS